MPIGRNDGCEGDWDGAVFLVVLALIVFVCWLVSLWI